MMNLENNGVLKIEGLFRGFIVKDFKLGGQSKKCLSNRGLRSNCKGPRSNCKGPRSNFRRPRSNFRRPRSKYLCALSEHIPGLTLREKVYQDGGLADDFASFYTACLLLALKHLEKLFIVHGDIHLGNVIICQANGYPVLIDLSDAMVVKAGFEKSRIDDLEDLARALYEMLTQEFAESPHYNLQNKKLSFKALKLLHLMSTRDKLKSLDIASITYHAYFKHIDWNLLSFRQLPSPVNKPSI